MAKLKKPTVKNPQLVEALAELKEHSTQEAAKKVFETLKEVQLIAPVIIEDMPENLLERRQAVPDQCEIYHAAAERRQPVFSSIY